MISIDRIEDPIVNGSEGFFDEPSVREDLHVTIRIAKDFYDFLVKVGETPSADQIDYMIGTIRSGMDWSFQLAYGCRCIDTGGDTWRFDRHTHYSFPELRESFMRRFEHLVESDDSAVNRLASLFALTHLELVFFAQNFPPPWEYKVTNYKTALENVMDLTDKLIKEKQLRSIKTGDDR